MLVKPVILFDLILYVPSTIFQLNRDITVNKSGKIKKFGSFVKSLKKDAFGITSLRENGILKTDQNKVQSAMDRCHDQTAYEKTPETLPSCSE